MSDANIEFSTADSAVILSEVSTTSELPSTPPRPSDTVDDETRRRKILSKLWGKGNKLSHKVRELDKSTISNSSDSSIHNDNDQQHLADHLSSFSSINDVKSATEDSSNSINSSKPLAVVKPIMVVNSGLVLAITIDRTRVNSEASPTTVTQINETTPTTTVSERQSSSSAKADRTSSKKKKSHQKDDSKKKKTSTRDKSKERDRSHHHNQTDESTNKKSNSSSKSHRREQEEEAPKNDDHHKPSRYHSSSSTSLSHHRRKSPSDDNDRVNRRSSPSRTARKDEPSSSKRSPLSLVDQHHRSSSKHERTSHRHRRRSSVTLSPSPPSRSRHSTTNGDRTQVKTSPSPKKDDCRATTASTTSNRAQTESSSHSKPTNANLPSDSHRPKAQASDENLTILSKSQEKSPDLPHPHSSSTSIKTEKSKLSTTTTNNEDSDRRKVSSSRHERRSHSRNRSRSKEIKKERKTVESTNTDDNSIHKSKSTHEKSSTSVHEKSNNDAHRRKSSSDYHRYDRHDSPSRYDRRNDDHRHHRRHRVPSSHSYYPSTHYVHHHHHHHYRSPSPRYHHHHRRSISPRSHPHRSRYFSSSSSSLSFSPRRRSPSRTSSSSSRSSSSYSSISRTSSSRSPSRNNHYYPHHHRQEKKFRRSPTLEKLFLKASESIESVSTQKNPNASSSIRLIPLPTSASSSEIQMISPRNTLSEPNNFYAKSFSGFSAPPPPFLTQPPPHQRYLKEITTESSTSCHSMLNEVQTVPLSNHDELISTKPDLSTNGRSGASKPPRVSRFSDIVSSLPSEPVLNTNLSVHTPVNYTQISENINCLPSSRRQQKRHNREVVECECTTGEYDRSRGIKACGHECLNRMLLIECGPMCPCGQWCTNRRFQRRSYASHKLALFKTEMKGHGLRTIASIRKGRFLVEYVGEVVDMDELARRNKKYKRDGNIHQYVMSLIHGTVIDSTIKGNWARFINHSCEPNCVAEKWLVNGEYRMGIFAKRDLDAGEEITIDYRFEASNSADLINEKCYCGAPTCRGTISVKSNNNNFNKRQNRRQPLDDDELLDYLRDEETNEYIIPKTIDEIRQLIQIMSRTDSENVRTIELDLLRNHSQKQFELPRLFLECNGLHVLCSWMKDILIENDDDEQQQYSDEFKYHLLDFVHSVLPIKDRTTVIKNGLFDLVCKKLKLPSTTDDTALTDQEQIDHLMDSMLNHLDNPIIAKLFHIYSSWMSLKERYIIPKRKEPEQLSDHHYHHHRHRSHHHSSKHADEETSSRFHFSTRASSIQQRTSERSSGRRLFIVRDLPRTQEQQLSKDERRKLFEQQYEDEEKARAAAIAPSNDESPGGQSEPPHKKQRTSDSNEPTLPNTPPQSQTTLHSHHMDQTYSIYQHLSQIPIDYIRSYLSSIGQSVSIADGLNEKDELPLPPPTRPEDEHELSRIIRLPPGWSVTVCSSDSSVYFYNRQTMSTSWAPPSLTSPTDESASIPHPLDLSPLSSAQIIEQRRPHHHHHHIYQEQSSSSSRSDVKPSKHLPRHSRSHRHHHLTSSNNSKRKRPSAVDSTTVVQEELHPHLGEEASTIPSSEQSKQEEFNGLKSEEQTEELSTSASKELINESHDIDMSTTVKESAEIDDNDDEQASSNNNTLSSSSKTNRDLLRKNISQHVHTTLKPYTKRTCKQGRIVSTDDIKYLVKKFTLAVLDKEIEKAKNEGSLLSPVLTDRVRLKTEVYVKKYMNKVGPVFQRHDGTVHPSSQTLPQTSESITTTGNSE